ncbi:MAG: hypothetical protein ACJ74Y_10280 [Bryobacteraceae bacterium]
MIHFSPLAKATSALRAKSKTFLTVSAVALSCATLSLAQNGPQITVSPGIVITVAGRTNAALTAATFNGIAARGSIVYVSDSHLVGGAGNAYVANIYAVDLNSGQVTRIAGPASVDLVNGNSGYSGDGGPATEARLKQPSGLALDAAGNLYVADSGQNVVRKIDTNGIITTVAGNGDPSLNTSSGDGGPARSAKLTFPTAVTVSAAGDLYISETLGARVRIVSGSSQVINTIAGNGTAGFSGDNGPAVNANLNYPSGIAVDGAGNLYIADRFNNVIREVSSTGIINTVAGQAGQSGGFNDGAGSGASFSSPYDVAVDRGGAVYVNDSANNRIRRIATDGARTVTTVAGNGSGGFTGDGSAASNAGLLSPTSITVADTGDLFFVDNAFRAIRRLTSNPAPAVFPLTAIGNSSSLTVTVSATGNQALSVSQINPPTNFTVTGGTCGAAPFPLSAGNSCTLVLTFTPNGGSTSGTLTVVSNAANAATTSVLLSMSNGLYFVPLATPCRVVDTRWPNGTFGGPFLNAEQTRPFAIRFSSDTDTAGHPGACPAAPIPSGANVQAYSLNVTAVPRGPSLRWLTVSPSNSSVDPNGVSTLNAYDGRTKANAVIVPADTGDNNRAVSVFAKDATDVIIDINGYYVPESTPSSLAYYPMPPCRAVDTRDSNLASGLGSPSMGTNETRTFPIQGQPSGCSLPVSAQAYALNFTAVPRSNRLAYLTVWPAGQGQPIVSTLNATTGAVTANAAIVPVPSGSNGQVSVYTTDPVDLIIDVSGYYAPPASGGLALYNVTPCRAFDSRGSNFQGAPISGVYNVNIAGGCTSVSGTAQSLVLNATVVPAASLSYLTLWAKGASQPLQSTLNAYDSAVASNLAVVPTTDGYISSFSTAPTAIIFDVFGYFAP